MIARWIDGWILLLYLLGFVALESPAQAFESAFDGFGVALESTLAPAILALFVGDLDEVPTGEDAEMLDGLDFDHFGGGWARIEQESEV